MRNFIVSDLHGNGNVYESIITYLSNVDTSENVTLYINGDLIDRGLDSPEMILDVYDRIINNKGFKIEYLAGNHEYMMYNASKRLEYNKSFDSIKNEIWNEYNGYTNLECYIDFEEQVQLCDFISNLKLYHKFKETINEKEIVLVHAKCPSVVKDVCDLKIKDTIAYYNEDILKRDYEYSLDDEIFVCTWARKGENYFKEKSSRVGDDNYFTIIGHTPVINHPGFKYDKEDNVLNVDGASSNFAIKLASCIYDDEVSRKYTIDELTPELCEERHRLELSMYDHTPLVEIQDNKLKILIFNRLNQIIDGYYFYNNNFYSISEEELDIDRYYLNTNNKMKLKRL